MKLKRSVISLAVLFGILTTFLTVSYLNSTQNQLPEGMKTTQVVVAKTNIIENTKITADMVELKTVISSSIHLNSIRDINEAIGQITSDRIIAGEQIIKDRLAIGQTDTSISFTIPENMRAIAIPINETTGVGGYVSIGDKIDIIVNEVVNGKNIAYTKLQNITVIRKGANPAENAEILATNKGLTQSLTVLVTPAQAEILGYALNMGSPISVSLRNPTDNNKVPLTEYGQNNLDSWTRR